MCVALFVKVENKSPWWVIPKSYNISPKYKHLHLLQMGVLGPFCFLFKIWRFIWIMWNIQCDLENLDIYKILCKHLFMWGIWYKSFRSLISFSLFFYSPKSCFSNAGDNSLLGIFPPSVTVTPTYQEHNSAIFKCNIFFSCNSGEPRWVAVNFTCNTSCFQIPSSNLPSSRLSFHLLCFRSEDGGGSWLLFLGGSLDWDSHFFKNHSKCIFSSLYVSCHFNFK